MSQTLQIERANELRHKPDGYTRPLGTELTHYLCTNNYPPEHERSGASIGPYQNLQLSPSSQAIHYGQSVFEGLKAYKQGDDILLFRPDQNFKRMNESLSRLSMPEINEENALNALYELLKVERDWVPDGEGQSLYIRPFVFADEPFLGVRPSETYQFNIILSPVGGYYGATQLNPTSIYVEDDFVRSVRGGVGFAKVSGNYAASLLAQKKA